ncbi:hypothetical protein BBAD15_g927 [Beauveria bassiana D1-5]|uniref:Uncharacterized protein n=1 Tax=Beauveria bassiana D1-5 TaxID=1245745 RepID=A0A0A2VZP3_BEABA|nr:hypothetical protein BBAD15_g927 [Beauveria bassiana D1-5]
MRQIPYALPAHALVKYLRIATGGGIKYQHRLSLRGGDGFEVGHQALGNTFAPRLTMHQQLGHIGPVRLVFRLAGNQLHGADNVPLAIFRHNHRAFAPRHALPNLAPECRRFFRG